MTSSQPDAAPAGGRATGPLRALQPQRELLEALRARQLVLHYQPIVSLENLDVLGVEALLRWEHPVAGVLPPDDFLPGSTHAPAMRKVTKYVLGLACEEVNRWPGWTVAVNVAAADVVHARFVDDVVAALESSGLSPARLTLELTEQSVVQDIALATTHLTALRDLGVGVALDDFGTGYSSLLYLRELPITQLKIDRLFVSAALKADEDAAIVESLVRLGRTINIDVVAEGVETAEQAKYLQGLGCPAAQGYLFGRPAPAPELDAGEGARSVGGAPGIRRRARAPLSYEPRTGSLVRHLMAEGASLHTIAAALNRAGTVTDKGVRWTTRSAALLVAGMSET